MPIRSHVNVLYSAWVTLNNINPHVTLKGILESVNIVLIIVFNLILFILFFLSFLEQSKYSGKSMLLSLVHRKKNCETQHL